MTGCSQRENGTDAMGSLPMIADRVVVLLICEGLLETSEVIEDTGCFE